MPVSIYTIYGILKATCHSISWLYVWVRLTSSGCSMASTEVRRGCLSLRHRSFQVPCSFPYFHRLIYYIVKSISSWSISIWHQSPVCHLHQISFPWLYNILRKDKILDWIYIFQLLKINLVHLYLLSYKHILLPIN